MSNTIADTARDKEFVGDFTAGELDEFDGSSYPTTFATKYAIGTESVTIDTIDHDQKLTTTEGVLNKTTIGAGTRPVHGFVFYKSVTSYADSPLLGYQDLLAAGESFSPSGGAVNTTWDPEGIGKLQAEAI